MGAFERGDDAFEPGQFHERFKRLLIGGVGVLHAFFVVEPGVFGAHGGVVQTGADAVGELNLAKIVLQNVAARALQHAQ